MAKTPWKSVGRYGTVGIELVLSILIGLFGGQYLDVRFGTKWIWLAGFGLGIYAGFRGLFKTAAKMSRDVEESEAIAQGKELYHDEYLAIARKGEAAAGPDRGLRIAMGSVAGIGLALAMGSFSFFGTRFALSVTLMSTLGVTNLWVLAKIVGVLVPVEGRGASRGGFVWGLLGIVKLFVYFGVIYALLSRGLVDGLGLVVGLVSLPIGLAIGTLVNDTSAPRS